MCNLVARKILLGELRDDFSQVRITLDFPEGAPNMAPLDAVRITDPSVIVRAAPAAAGASATPAPAAQLVTRRWSWPGPSGKPVYNYRSEGRDFANSARGGRCLVPVSGFYEHTDRQVAPGQPKPKRKDKWLFTDPAHPFLCIAGLWRADPKVGEAFTLLTCEPGPDIAPYHGRQVVLMPRAHWSAWLDASRPAADLIAPTPAGTLAVTKAD